MTLWSTVSTEAIFLWQPSSTGGLVRLLFPGESGSQDVGSLVDSASVSFASQTRIA